MVDRADTISLTQNDHPNTGMVGRAAQQPKMCTKNTLFVNFNLSFIFPHFRKVHFSCQDEKIVTTVTSVCLIWNFSPTPLLVSLA